LVNLADSSNIQSTNVPLSTSSSSSDDSIPTSFREMRMDQIPSDKMNHATFVPFLFKSMDLPSFQITFIDQLDGNNIQSYSHHMAGSTVFVAFSLLNLPTASFHKKMSEIACQILQITDPKSQSSYAKMSSQLYKMHTCSPISTSLPTMTTSSEPEIPVENEGKTEEKDQEEEVKEYFSTESVEERLRRYMMDTGGLVPTNLLDRYEKEKKSSLFSVEDDEE